MSAVGGWASPAEHRPRLNAAGRDARNGFHRRRFIQLRGRKNTSLSQDIEYEHSSGALTVPA